MIVVRLMHDKNKRVISIACVESLGCSGKKGEYFTADELMQAAGEETDSGDEGNKVWHPSQAHPKQRWFANTLDFHHEAFSRTQFTIAPNLFSKLTKLKTKFGISCFKEGVSTALKSRYHPVLCVSYLVFVLAFLENLRFGLQFGLARKRNLVV